MPYYCIILDLTYSKCENYYIYNIWNNYGNKKI